jgi:two-component system nitrogen regulation response regulator NtrX
VGGEHTVRVSVRVVSATYRNLSEMVTQNRFREDLYYRLSVVPIRVPALRDRPEDVRPLAEYFLADFCSRNNFKPKRIDDAIFPTLEAYAWPGNARELRNTIERMAILSPDDRLSTNYIPLEIRFQPDVSLRSTLQDSRESAERERIFEALEQTEWNVSAAARLLNIERTNLHKRMRALGLSRGN